MVYASYSNNLIQNYKNIRIPDAMAQRILCIMVRKQRREANSPKVDSCTDWVLYTQSVYIGPTLSSPYVITRNII